VEEGLTLEFVAKHWDISGQKATTSVYPMAALEQAPLSLKSVEAS
jgi:hypothetical protein